MYSFRPGGQKFAGFLNFARKVANFFARLQKLALEEPSSQAVEQLSSRGDKMSQMSQMSQIETSDGRMRISTKVAFSYANTRAHVAFIREFQSDAINYASFPSHDELR